MVHRHTVSVVVAACTCITVSLPCSSVRLHGSCAGGVCRCGGWLDIVFALSYYFGKSTPLTPR